MNGFTIYKEYYELITLLSEKEQGEMLLAISKYMFEDIEPEALNERQTKIFNNLRRPLKTSKENSLRRKINKEENETNQKPNKNQFKTNSKPKENQIDNQKKTHQDVNVIVNNNVNKKEDRGMGEEEKEDTNDTSTLAEISKKIIDYLNAKTNSKFRSSSKTTQSKINARLNEGYTLNDFIDVIDKKSDEWTGTEFEVHLCPETLFGTKFEKYLNQKTKVKKQEQLPRWFNEDLETEEPNQETIDEIDRLMKSIGE